MEGVIYLLQIIYVLSITPSDRDDRGTEAKVTIRQKTMETDNLIKQDCEALFMAKYYPRVAAVSCTQKTHTEKPT